MRKIAAVLMMAVLAVLAASLVSAAPAIQAQFGPVSLESGAAPVSPPLMYAGIRG
jgi:hypothetical protein